jgi:plasmid segregation protein ParM
MYVIYIATKLFKKFCMKLAYILSIHIYCNITEKEENKMTEKNWIVKAFDDGYGDEKFDSLGNPDFIPAAVSKSFKEKSSDSFSEESKLRYIAAEVDGERYLVGDYAMELDPNLKWTLGENKHKDKKFPILAKTVLGLMSPSMREDIDILMMNLPIHYDTPERRKILTDLLVGEHKIALSTDGKVFNKKVVTVKEVEIKKQPVGSIYDLLFNSNGDIEDASYAKGQHMIVDIGARTVNIMTVNRLEVVDDLTTQTNSGMFEAYKEVRKFLVNKNGGTIPDGKLPLIMRDKRLLNYDLTNLIDNVYTDHADTIFQLVDELLINSSNFINNVIFTGGGAEILESYLKPYFEGSKINPIFRDRYANVRGLRKYGLVMAKKRKPTISARIGSSIY